MLNGFILFFSHFLEFFNEEYLKIQALVFLLHLMFPSIKLLSVLDIYVDWSSVCVHIAANTSQHCRCADH